MSPGRNLVKRTTFSVDRPLKSLGRPLRMTALTSLSARAYSVVLLPPSLLHLLHPCISPRTPSSVKKENNSQLREELLPPKGICVHGPLQVLPYIASHPFSDSMYRSFSCALFTAALADGEHLPSSNASFPSPLSYSRKQISESGFFSSFIVE